MPTKRPLVVNGGTAGELSTGDVIAPAALGTGTSSAATVLAGNNTWVTHQQITVSASAPGSPAVNDLWLDIS